MQTYLLDFVAELTDDQRLLNGTRSVALEGEVVGGSEVWTLVLSFVQPKEAGAPIEEGDLTISGPGGDLFAGLAGGRCEAEIDEASGAEREALRLDLFVEGGEGVFDGARGTVRLLGALSGGEATLRTEIALEGAAEEADTHGCS